MDSDEEMFVSLCPLSVRVYVCCVRHVKIFKSEKKRLTNYQENGLTTVFSTSVMLDTRKKLFRFW